MYILRREIENLSERRINENIYVSGSVVYIENSYIFKDGNWYVNADGNWVNLQGGIPTYSVEENLDSDIFKEEENQA
ncbi:MAG: hypothetical protein RR342_01010 [Bacilli bacterium]